LRDHRRPGARDLVGRSAVGRHEFAGADPGIESGPQRHQTRHVEPRAQIIMAHAVALGRAGDAVEFDQHLAFLDPVAIPGVNRRHHSGFERLNHLDAADRNDLALRGGDDVDTAEHRPGQRDQEKCDQRGGDGASGRRRRRLHDLERRRQELAFGTAHPRRPPQRYHVIGRRRCGRRFRFS
jgi:hypothetical protein